MVLLEALSGKENISQPAYSSHDGFIWSELKRTKVSPNMWPRYAQMSGRRCAGHPSAALKVQLYCGRYVFVSVCPE